ncbi:sigma-E factor regulatory protein [Escherichia coli]|nr:sigma-E factor regulatory protein [Escherichia coli]
MIKEWATVVSWQNGQALVSCDVKASCSSCASRAGCGSRVLNKLGPQTTHTIVVPCDEPLVPGQKVELGIAEGSLLSSHYWFICRRWWDYSSSLRYFSYSLLLTSQHYVVRSSAVLAGS